MGTFVSPIRGATVAIPAAKRRTERRASRALGVILSIVGNSVDDTEGYEEELRQNFKEKKAASGYFRPTGPIYGLANHNCLFINIISAPRLVDFLMYYEKV